MVSWLVLPDQGTVYVATDFHAQWSNFNRWLAQTNLVERIDAGENVYGLILGDAVDHKPGDPIFEPYGDVKIVDQIMQLQQRLGEERLIYIRGNHELAAADAVCPPQKSRYECGQPPGYDYPALSNQPRCLLQAVQFH